MDDEKTPMENKDKFLWGAGDVQVIDFDPRTVTPVYREKLDKAINDCPCSPEEKAIMKDMLDNDQFEILFMALNENGSLIP